MPRYTNHVHARQPLDARTPRLAHPLALAIALAGASMALAGGDPPVIQSQADCSCGSLAPAYVSDDGTRAVETFETATPPGNWYWTLGSGGFTLPIPDGSAWWAAESLSSDGLTVSGNRHIWRSGVGFLPDGAPFTKVLLAPGNGGNLAIGWRSNASASMPRGFYRMTIGGSSSLVAATPGSPDYLMKDVNGDATVAVGSTDYIAPLPFRASPSGVELLPLPAGDTLGEALYTNLDGSEVIGRTWRVTPEGLSYQLVRWVGSTPHVIDLPGGASALAIWSSDERAQRLALNYATLDEPGGFNLRVWTIDLGLEDNDAYFARHGHDISPMNYRVWGWSSDGTKMVAERTDESGDNWELVVLAGFEHAACGEGASCFAAGRSGGCDDATCCTRVCTIDPLCCSSAWDAGCAQLAFQNCLCGGEQAGSCWETHAAPGCNNSMCCSSVCSADPSCCDTAWDAACVTIASAVCRACGNPTSGSCSEVHPLPNCSDEACCNAVCTIDPTCCNLGWDADCVAVAATACAIPGDLNGDGTVDAADLALLLANWGAAGAGDLDGDGTTNAADLSILLANWS